MTSLIRDVLAERAERAGAPGIDLDRVIADGDHRARRARTARVVGSTAGIGLLAAASVVAVSVVGADPAGRTGPTDPAGQGGQDGAAVDPTDTRAVGWSEGSEIHLPQSGTVLDVGGRIASYTAVDDGFVWSDPAGAVWFQPSDGSAGTEIGSTSTEGSYLVSDDAGPLAAWVDVSDADDPQLVVHDTATGDEVLRTGEDTGPGMSTYADARGSVHVIALDDGAVVWSNERGVVSTDVASGRSEVLAAGRNGLGVEDAAGPFLASPSSSPDGSDDGTWVGTTVERGRETDGRAIRHQGNANLSPTGRWVSFEDADELFVTEVATGREVAAPLPAGTPAEYSAVVQWTGDDTYAVFSIRSLDELDDPDGPGETVVDFAECDVVTGSCETVASPTLAFDDFQLPVGENLVAE